MQSNVEKSNKALFIQRVLAYVVDVFIVTMIASLVATPFIDQNAVDKLNDSAASVIEDYVNGKIDENTYLKEAMGLSYQIAKKTGVSSLITIFFGILYFIVFQFYNKGQTIGKRFLKIKVVSDDGELTMNQLVFRALIINSILLQMIMMTLITFGTRDIYTSVAVVIEFLQYSIILISAFMIMFNRSGKGLHDFVTHTKVVRIV